MIRIPIIANINCVNSVLINTNDPAKIAIKGMIGYNGTLYGRSIFGSRFLKILQQQMTYNRTTK